MRITQEDLIKLAKRLNTVCGFSLYRFSEQTGDDGLSRNLPSPNHYYIRANYGGYQLVQQSSRGTRCRGCLGGGYDSPMVLRGKLLSFLEGIELGLEMAKRKQ